MIYLKTLLLGLWLVSTVEAQLSCPKDRWIFTKTEDGYRGRAEEQVGDIIRSATNPETCALKCQMEDDCEAFAFSEEDFKCQLINEGDVTEKDTDPQFKLYQATCLEETFGGWRMVFKAGGGTDRSFFDDFDSAELFNHKVTEAKQLNNKVLFNNGELKLWGSSDPPMFVDVEMRLYDDNGKEILAIRFGAVGKTQEDFFTPDNVLYHPWLNDPTSMTLAREAATFGTDLFNSFKITDADGDCMLVLESDPSWNNVEIKWPAILYVEPGTAGVSDWRAALVGGSAKIAAAMAIFVR